MTPVQSLFQPSLETKLKRPEKPGKKKQQEKKKSNLEIFKEELKAMQEEREERHRIKNMVRSGEAKGFASGTLKSEASSTLYSDGKESGSHDNGDPNTTNLYLGNLSPKYEQSSC